jgi:hypothetical protein
MAEPTYATDTIETTRAATRTTPSPSGHTEPDSPQQHDGRKGKGQQ